jgi:hypothetical protein
MRIPKERPISQAGRKLLAYLRLAAVFGPGNVWPSTETIATRVGVTPRTVQRQIAELVRRGLLHVLVDPSSPVGRRFLVADLTPASRPDVTLSESKVQQSEHVVSQSVSDDDGSRHQANRPGTAPERSPGHRPGGGLGLVPGAESEADLEPSRLPTHRAGPWNRPGYRPGYREGKAAQARSEAFAIERAKLRAELAEPTAPEAVNLLRSFIHAATPKAVTSEAVTRNRREDKPHGRSEASNAACS